MIRSWLKLCKRDFEYAVEMLPEWKFDKGFSR